MVIIRKVNREKTSGISERDLKDILIRGRKESMRYEPNEGLDYVDDHLRGKLSEKQIDEIFELNYNYICGLPGMRVNLPPR
jgi:hypothetical protein